VSETEKQSPAISDGEVSRTVVSRELATRKEVDRCVDKKARLAGQGRHVSLLEVLVDQGAITKNQARRLLKKAEESVDLKQIPGYQLLERLGQGSMGVVYRAKQLSMDRVVAIKVLLKSLAMNKEYITRFQREARLAAKLNNSHIVQAIDVGQAGNHHFFVMECVTGTTLKEYMDGSRVYEELEALRIIHQVADALNHAHQRGLIHRDVKPENIIISADGVVKLADLGLARQTADEKTSSAEAGLVVGTPYYISPEQIRGERDVDARTDIYSLGGTLYHMVTGQVPFSGPNPKVVMQRHLHEQLKPPDHINTELSNGLGEMVETMMAKRREDRYPTTADLIADIDSLLLGEAPMLARGMTAQPSLAGLADAEDQEDEPDEAENNGAEPAIRAPDRDYDGVDPKVLWLSVVLAFSLGINLLIILLAIF